jgi:parallel beta-helix repeat protein
VKSSVFAALIFTGFIALNIVCVLPTKAQYQGNITINADGSVSAAQIVRTSNVYTLKSDVDGNLFVDRSNIIFDGNGHTVNGLLRVGSLPTAPTVGVSYISNVTVVNFNVKGSDFGISLESASNVTVANNTVTGTGNGILSLDEPTAAIAVEGGGSNVITGNIIANNYIAILFLETENNLIVGNTIENSSTVGIGFWGASNNIVYHNNFVNNAQQAGSDTFNSPSSGNVWDAGYPLGGNYWSDYLTRYPSVAEIDGSGIGNTSYVIKNWFWRPGSENQDRYPLMEPYTEATYLMQTTPPKISMLNHTVTGSNVSLAFTVDKIVNWTGYSLDGQQNVTITDNTTLTRLSSGVHNVTVYANDTYGNMGTSETVAFTIPEPFPIVPVAAVAVVVAVMVAAGLLVYFKKRKRKA